MTRILFRSVLGCKASGGRPRNVPGGPRECRKAMKKSHPSQGKSSQIQIRIQIQIQIQIQIRIRIKSKSKSNKILGVLLQILTPNRVVRKA